MRVAQQGAKRVSIHKIISGNFMTKLLPIIFAAILLCGCPDAKVPKVPPKAPEPKILLKEKRGDMVMSPPEHLAGTQFAEPRVPTINC